jgi:hypothetical protein
MVITILFAESPPDLPLTWSLLGVMGSVAAGTAILIWFVRDQFSKQQRMFFRIISRHNREDDDRFDGISNELWNIRLTMARNHGEPLPPRETFPRRRYLVDDAGGGNGADDPDQKLDD